MSAPLTKKYVDKIMALVPLSSTVVPGAPLVGANITKACVDNLAEAQEAASLMNFTVRRLEQRLKDTMGERDEYRRAIVDLEAKIKRLEEAGDALKAAGYFGGWADAVNKWIKAREAKP